MIGELIAMFMAFGQPVLRDAGPSGAKADENVRRAVIPGKLDPRIKPIEGFSCRTFLGYSEVQTHFNLKTGDKACSGEMIAGQSEGFRQVNYLATPAGPLPVLIFSPRNRIDTASRIVIYLNGGPRSLVTNRPLAQRLVAEGYTVLMPIYLGELETRHPEPDMPGAMQQVRALSKWAGRRLVATVGVSTGAYLAAASCAARCGRRILLAPPLTTPEEGLSDERVDWAKLTDRSCLWRRGGSDRVCSNIKPLAKSFWGNKYYRTDLADVLRGRCAGVRILVSSSDERVYDAKGVADLRTAGCEIETPAGYPHAMVDAAPVLIDHTIRLIARNDGRLPS